MLSDFYIRLRSLIRRTKVEEELDDELRFHLEHQIKKHVQAGMSPEEALRRARIEFGGLIQIKEKCREARGTTFATALAQDLRYALRILRSSPGFTAVIVVTLALGIGATTAIFTLVNAVMLRMLPVRDPQQLVVAQWWARDSPHHLSKSSFGDCSQQGRRAVAVGWGCSLSYPMYKEIAAKKDLFSAVAAFAGPAELDMSGNGPASIARGELVSGNYFETLGVTAYLGRVLQPEDEEPGAAAVAVLDYAYWKHAFGGSPSAIGRTVRLNNIAFIIVGVADRSFTRLTPGKGVDLWVPLDQTTALGLPWAGKLESNNWWLTVTGRLRSGVSRQRAQAAVDVLFVNGALHGEKPVWKTSDNPQLRLLPAQKALTGFRAEFGKPLRLLMAAVLLVLMIACSNVAGLMLSRGAARQREMAVRLALGSGRRRIVRQLLTESLFLSFVGAAFGALLAYWGATGLAAFISQNSYYPPEINLHPDGLVLLFAIGVTVLTGIGFGLAPALRAARANVSAELKGASTTTTQFGNGRHFAFGRGLVVVQVALSMVVLTGAGLLIRTLSKLHSIDAGFDTRNILLFTIEPQLTGYRAKQTQNLYENLQSRLAALPGVLNVSYSSSALLDGSLRTGDVFIEGKTDRSPVETQMLSVGPDYFATMRIPLITGRLLGGVEIRNERKAAVVNQAFVRRFLNGRNPIGSQFKEDPKGPGWEIVGVVGDTKYENLRSAEAPVVFEPLTAGGAEFALRTAVAPSNLIPAVQHVVNSVDDNLPVTRMRTQTQAIDRLLFNERLVERLLGLFGTLGLALTCIGLYGLLSFEVARRTREIGIRTALGAQRSVVWTMVVKQGLALVMIGAAAGCGAAVIVMRLLTGLLYDVPPTDPGTFALVAGLLLVVGVIACSIPAQRATHVDPMVALRCE